MSPPVPSVILATGATMPLFGLGTWLSQPGEVEAAVELAIKAGYRLIDGAFIYRNEKEVGNAIKKVIQEGVVKREELFITSKLWCNYFHPNDIELGLQKSLKDLQLDYVDLFLLHLPTAFKRDPNVEVHVMDANGKIAFDESIDLLDTWKGMEDVFNKGLTKAIGVSNFSISQIQRIIDGCTIKPHNQQVECYLYFPQFEMQAFCNKHGITMTGYGPLGSPGRFKLDFIEWKDTPAPMEDETIKKLAAKFNKKPSHVLLKWLVQRNISVIPKSVNPDRIKDNFDIWDFELSAEDMQLLNNIPVRARMFLQDHVIGHKEDPIKDERKTIL